MTWRATCECGWTGEQLPAYDDGKYRSPDCAEDVEERLFYPFWAAHVGPYPALFELDEMTAQLRELEQRIAEKVQPARSVGRRG